MNQKYNELAATMLDMASDEFSNHGCNDLEPSLFNGWTDDEKIQLIKDFELYNCGHLDDLEEPINPNRMYMGDSGLMGFFAQMLRIEQNVQTSVARDDASSNQS